jgi:hypothetical protein
MYPTEFAHLDPDLRSKALEKRPENWRAAFGQSGSAAGLLINQSVGDGALFIFFGWFRRTVKVNGKLAFDRTDVNGRHIVWGWLEVGKVWKVVVPPPNDLRFLDDHPHVKFSEAQGPRNTVYVSSESGLKAGVFSTESESVVLTKEGEGGRSVWLLPEEFESLFLHVTCRITLMRRDGTGRARELRFRRWGADRNLCLTVSDILRRTNTSLIVSRLL